MDAHTIIDALAAVVPVLMLASAFIMGNQANQARFRSIEKQIQQLREDAAKDKEEN